MAKRSKTAVTYLECEVCENIVTIHRKRGKMREFNHIKHMHCYKCQQIQAHIEKKEALFLPEWLRETEDETELG